MTLVFFYFLKIKKPKNNEFVFFILGYVHSSSPILSLSPPLDSHFHLLIEEADPGIHSHFHLLIEEADPEIH